MEHKYRPKNNKKCSVCEREFRPNSPTQTLCGDTCRYLHYMFNNKNKVYINGEYIKQGYKQLGPSNNNYRKGVWTKRNNYRNVRKDYCERCGATELLLVHHRDHNRDNYIKSNLETLCRKCHQRHHLSRDKNGKFKSSKV